MLHLLCVCIGVTKYRCVRAYKGVSATVATIRELALGEGMAYGILIHILHLLCVCIGVTQCRSRTAYKGFSATVATMRELALGEGWNMVSSSTSYL